MTLDKEKEKLFKQVRTKLGGGIRKVELTDDVLCDLLDIAIGVYAERVQNFIIENNWANLFGKDLTNTDLAFAMSVRTIDLTKDYSSYFSKEVGLQARGNGKWELKKDFIKLEKGKQVYIIPKGREISGVLWFQIPTVDQALWATYGGLSVNFGGFNAQMGMSTAAMFGGVGNRNGMLTGLYGFPAYDISLYASDIKYKQSLIKGDLTYRITALNTGEHLLHLMSTPGSKLSFGGNSNYPLYNCVCWYTYYDVTSDNVDECRKQNSDVILSPDQIPLDEMDYSYFNAPTKAIIRQLLIAEAAETLGFALGKFSGSINMINSPLQIEYQMFISMGQREKENALRTLDERLQRMSPYAVMEKQAKLVNDMLETKKGTPLGMYII